MELGRSITKPLTKLINLEVLVNIGNTTLRLVRDRIWIPVNINTETSIVNSVVRPIINII